MLVLQDADARVIRFVRGAPLFTSRTRPWAHMAQLPVLPLRARLHLDGQRQWVCIDIILSLDFLVSVPETGGLLRIAIKVMMACATENRELRILSSCYYLSRSVDGITETTSHLSTSSGSPSRPEMASWIYRALRWVEVFVKHTAVKRSRRNETVHKKIKDSLTTSPKANYRSLSSTVFMPTPLTRKSWAFRLFIIITLTHC